MRHKPVSFSDGYQLVYYSVWLY